MKLLANDLSVHEQFPDTATFHEALAQLMKMRVIARKFEREVHCHVNFRNVKPVANVPMEQAIGSLIREEQRAAMTWITKSTLSGGDWLLQESNDYLECRGEVVTESAVGEAAIRMLQGFDCGLVSVMPSDWNDSLVNVTWCREAEQLKDQSTDLRNWWEPQALEVALLGKAPLLQSWYALRQAVSNRFEGLTFADNCFAPLAGHPFSDSAANGFIKLLDILDRLVRASDSASKRTAEGNEMYNQYFIGKRALFSDSSDSEKRQFRPQLTFDHPDEPGQSLYCTWHGKVSHGTYRLHFSWPVSTGKPVYIMYAGPKITRR